jgi:hypothetical protein
MKTWWDNNNKIRKEVIAFWSYCYVLFAWNNWWSPLQFKLAAILAVKWIYCFQNGITDHYQYTGKDAVIKLSFWVYWHVMLLMCCRLQKLEVYFCKNMTDRGLLEGIGSLKELTSLCLTEGHKLTAQALSTFFHRPSMTSIVFFKTSGWSNLDDEGLKGIAKRCDTVTYLHF